MHVPAFFKGAVAVSKELSLDEQQFQEDLKRFLQAFNVKQDVARHLNAGEAIHYHLSKLQWALKEELESLDKGVDVGKEIIYDLKYLSKDEYIRHIDELCNDLKQIKAHDKMIRHVLIEIEDIVKAEAHKVRAITKGNYEHDEEVEMLKDLFVIEKHLVEKLGNIEDFRDLFKGIYIGETREEKLQGVRKRFKDSVFEKMTSVLIGEDGKAYPTDDHYISELTANIFNRLEQEIMEAVHSGKIGSHPHTDYEYVNSRLFEQFVHSEIDMDRSRGKIVPSSRTILAFISIFRKLYNEEALPTQQTAQVIEAKT